MKTIACLLSMLVACAATAQEIAAPGYVKTNVTKGEYCAWYKSRSGMFIAKTKDDYDKICKLINQNKNKTIYEFADYDGNKIYFLIVAPSNFSAHSQVCNVTKAGNVASTIKLSAQFTVDDEYKDKQAWMLVSAEKTDVGTINDKTSIKLFAAVQLIQELSVEKEIISKVISD